MAGPARHLFYKDTEVVGRFVEEILVSKDTHDLVPILHRFAAYLETLSDQSRPAGGARPGRVGKIDALLRAQRGERFSKEDVKTCDGAYEGY